MNDDNFDKINKTIDNMEKQLEEMQIMVEKIISKANSKTNSKEGGTSWVKKVKNM